MAACSFSFDNWNMGIETPDGGVIEGSEVTRDGPSAYWATSMREIAPA
jgi:hypothetical protein